MKKINLFALLLIAIAFTSCGDGFNSVKCLNSVQEAYPNSEVFQIPKFDYKFIVVDSNGTVTYVETLNADDAKISAKAIIKRGNNLSKK